MIELKLSAGMEKLSVRADKYYEIASKGKEKFFVESEKKVKQFVAAERFGRLVKQEQKEPEPLGELPLTLSDANDAGGTHTDRSVVQNSTGTSGEMYKHALGVGIAVAGVYYMIKNTKNGNIPTDTLSGFGTGVANQVVADLKTAHDVLVRTGKEVVGKLPDAVDAAKNLANSGAEVAGHVVQNVTEVAENAAQIFQAALPTKEEIRDTVGGLFQNWTFKLGNRP